MPAKSPPTIAPTSGNYVKPRKPKFHTLYKAIGGGWARGQIEPLESRIFLSSAALLKPSSILPNVVAGDDSSGSLVVTAQPPATIIAGQPFGLTVTDENNDGSINTGFTGDVTISDSYGQHVYGTTTMPAVRGVAAFSGLSEDSAINGDELEASAAGLPVAYSSSFNITGASATHLVASTPSNVLANGNFSLTIVAEDQFGNIDRSFNGNITLALSANPGGASLGGTLWMPAANGAADFTDLTLNKSANGYALRATAAGLPAVTTSAFAVTDQLVVTTQPPANIVAGAPFSVVVTAEDGLGNVASSFTGSVTVANVAGNTLAGALTVNAVNGVATFTSLAEDQAASYPYLTVSAPGLPTTDTNPINVTAATATHLIVSAPSSTLVNGSFTVTADAVDQFGNIDPTFTGNVTIALSANPGNATLGGTLTIPAVAGVASFTGLTINQLGTGYTLAVSANSLRSATTAAFDMTDQLVVTTQPPASIAAGTPFGVVVSIEGGDGKVDSSFEGGVSVKDIYAYQVYGTTTVTAVNGVATFSGLTENIAINGEELQASSTGLAPVLTGAFAITGAAATHLSLSAPGFVVANGAFNLTVDALDQFGNLDPTFSGNVTLTLATNPANATLGGTLTVAAVNGVATFTGLTINKLGSGYTLQAAATGLNTGATLQFDVADQLVVTTQPPANVDVGAPFEVDVAVEDGDGVVNTSFDGSVTVQDYYGHQIYGKTTVMAVNGMASFPGLSEHVAMSGDLLEFTSNGLPNGYSNSFNDVREPATQLLIATPSSVVVNGTFGLTVDATDQYGNIDPTFNGMITLALSANPGSATLGGTLQAQAVNGVAMFSDLTINAAAGGYTLQASATGLGSVATAPFSVTYQLSVITQPPSDFAAETPFGLAVAVEDGDGAVDTSFSGTIALSDFYGHKLYGTLTALAVHGVATFSQLTEGAAINGDELEASSPGLQSTFTNPFTVTALTATQLATTAPSSVFTNRPFNLTVDAVDQNGVVDSTFNGNVTLALSANPQDATLGGTLTVQAFNGVAMFTGLTINKVGGGYTLQATTPGLTSAATTAFNVADTLVVTSQPPSTVAPEARFGLIVTAEDGLGNVDPSFTGTVTVADGVGNTLAGTISVTAVKGVATFTGLTINTVGSGYALQATSAGSASATTSAFNVADLLVVTSQPPSTVAAGASFGLIVKAENGLGTIDASFDGMVTIADAAGNTLTGTLSVPAAAGVATFTGLSESTVLSGDSLEVSSSGLTSGYSNAFTVTPPIHLIPPVGVIFAQAPTGGTAGSAINPAIVVDVVDSNNDVVTSNDSEVTLIINTGPSGANISGTFTAAAVNGVATFANVMLNTAGNYTLQATDGMLAAATSGNFTIVPAGANKLVITQQPTDTAAHDAISPAITVAVEDQFGNVVAGNTSTVTLALGASPSGASLGGTLSVAAIDGLATFSGISPSKAGAYTLSAADGALTPATSDGFSAGKMAITQEPTDVKAGAAIPIVADIQKPSGKVLAGDDSQITISIATGPSGATITGTATAAAVKGVVNFSDLSLTKAGAYTLTITDGGITASTVSFTVSAAAAADLAFVQNPTAVTAGQTIAPAITVSVTDSFGNPVTGAKVKLAIASGPAGSTLAGTLKATAQNGRATFNNISLTQSGSYTLQATHGSLTATSSDFTVSAAAADKLAFFQQPTGATVGSALAPAITVDVEDSFGNVVTTDDSNVVLTLKPSAGSPDAVLDGTLTMPAQSGQSIFSDVSLSEAGTYKLKAKDGKLTAAKSAAFSVLAAS
jgi:hypothetical protein